MASSVRVIVAKKVAASGVGSSRPWARWNSFRADLVLEPRDEVADGGLRLVQHGSRRAH
jgi:hypothetical protein